MDKRGQLNRRSWLGISSSLALGSLAQQAGVGWNTQAHSAEPLQAKPVAGIVTAYEKILHADVLLTKVLAGWGQDGGPGPAIKLASLYVDQFGPKDLARPMAKKYGVPIFDSIEGAVTLGGNQVAVDGVISIGEHGKYPLNKKGQQLYPRRRFFDGIADTFEKHGRVVPVFSDKHLGPEWRDASAIYERARKMKIPMMAGSSLPVTFRRPAQTIPMGAEIEAAVGVGYGDLDRYGSHTLDCFQCLVERRRNAEGGVEWVECLRGDAIWKAVDQGVVREDLMQAVLRLIPVRGGSEVRGDSSSSLLLFRYTDGLLGAVFMLPHYAGGIGAAIKLRGQADPVAVHFEERAEPAIPHFAYLLKAIERMVHTGKPSYPVERTVLTSGILDQGITSRLEESKRLLTPQLQIGYEPVDYPFAPHIDLNSDPRKPLS